jgi:hypothetical protein
MQKPGLLARDFTQAPSQKKQSGEQRLAIQLRCSLN